MISVLDTGFLYALFDCDDLHHTDVLRTMAAYRGRIILPVAAITEVAYLVKRNLGIEALVVFLESLTEVEYEFEMPTANDLVRSAEILRIYQDANLDFVDVSIFAMAERMGITKILTVDPRHFSMFRPSHCNAFEILP